MKKTYIFLDKPNEFMGVKGKKKKKTTITYVQFCNTIIKQLKAS